MRITGFSSRGSRLQSPVDPGMPLRVRRTQLAKCESKKKGLIMGAVFGAAAGVAIGAVFVNAVSGGATNGDTQSIVYSGLAGAGIGALAGIA